MSITGCLGRDPPPRGHFTGYLPKAVRAHVSRRREAQDAVSSIEHSHVGSGRDGCTRAIYCLNNTEEAIEATDVGVRRGATWVTANDGWKCSRSGGPESCFPMALPWSQEHGGSAQWLECSEGTLHGRCCIYSSGRRRWRE